MPSHRPSLLLLRASSVARVFVTACLVIVAGFAATPATLAQDITVSGTDGPRSKVVDGKARDSQEPLTIKARVAAGSLPPSRLYAHINASDAAATHRLSRLTDKLIRRQQSLTKRNPIGITRQLPRALRLTSDATIFDTPEGRISLIKIVAEEARQLRAHFSDVALPEGARLFVYSAKNPDEVYGAFTGRGDSDTGEFWTPPVEGDAIIIEYVAPPNATEVTDRLPFTLDRISHIYRSPREAMEKTAGACNQNVPDEWKATARSVGLIEFVAADGTGEYVCTGTLINARNNDLTPYFLTANHCISVASEAQSAYVHWFYDSPGNPLIRSYSATLLSTNKATDYSLLMIEGGLPNDLRWAGWTTSYLGVGGAVTGIHHPDGDYKRISYGNSINDSCPSGSGGLPGACQNFHKIRWNTGTTEGGSSGSGLWTGTSADPLLIGTLWGGFALCSNPTGTDFYGRFDLTYPAIANFLEGGSDDEFENSDTRSEARAIIAGQSSSNLIVKSVDDDWYRFSVPAGTTFAFKIFNNGGNGGMDLQLFRDGETVSIGVAEARDGGLAIGEANKTGRTIEYFVRVFLRNDTRNTYTFSLAVETCIYTVLEKDVTIHPDFSHNIIKIEGSPRCDWTVASSVEWLTVNPPSWNTSTKGFFSFGAKPNLSHLPRVGKINVGDQVVTITQEGLPCFYGVTPTSRAFSQSGGSAFVRVTARDGRCDYWMPTSNADWLKVALILDEGLDGTVNYTVEPNTSTAERTGTLTVAGQQITVKQVGTDTQWQSTTLAAGAVKFKSWAYQGRLYAYVKLIFPNTGYRVADWGEAAKTSGGYLNNKFTADLRIEKTTGASLPVETTTAFIYQLDSSSTDNTLTLRLSSQTAHIYEFKFAGGARNTLDGAREFALEHYRDFLSREPDAPGLDFWTNEITSCNGDAQCIDRKRVNVSGSFFLSQEFQVTGYYVYRMYKGALGRAPYYSEFMPDTKKVAAGIVVNDRLSANVINTNKEAFAREFVARAEFRTMYDTATDAQFIDRLFQKTGDTPTASERDALLAELGDVAGTQSERRARVLLRIVDGIRAVPPANGGVEVNQVFETRYGKAFYDREYNPAFVQMQYFGYLRRDPDQAGFEFWLNKLNTFGNFKDAEMVRSFILAPEYRARFGQP